MAPVEHRSAFARRDRSADRSDHGAAGVDDWASRSRGIYARVVRWVTSDSVLRAKAKCCTLSILSFATLERQTVLDQVPLFAEQFAIADDTEAVTNALCQLMAESATGGKQVHDANIVAAMIAHGVPALLTHNAKYLQRFGDRIRVEMLDASEKG